MDKKTIQKVIAELMNDDIIQVSCCCQSQKTTNLGNGYVAASGC